MPLLRVRKKKEGRRKEGEGGGGNKSGKVCVGVLVFLWTPSSLLCSPWQLCHFVLDCFVCSALANKAGITVDENAPKRVSDYNKMFCASIVRPSASSLTFLFNSPMHLLAVLPSGLVCVCVCIAGFQMIVAVSSDRGLCGGIHSGLSKAVRAKVAALPDGSDFVLTTIGDKPRGILSVSAPLFMQTRARGGEGVAIA